MIKNSVKTNQTIKRKAKSGPFNLSYAIKMERRETGSHRKA